MIENGNINHHPNFTQFASWIVNWIAREQPHQKQQALHVPGWRALVCLVFVPSSHTMVLAASPSSLDYEGIPSWWATSRNPLHLHLHLLHSSEFRAHSQFCNGREGTAATRTVGLLVVLLVMATYPAFNGRERTDATGTMLLVLLCVWWLSLLPPMGERERLRLGPLDL